MNGGRSDASTSTDDIRGRPLCLFYFTHPFGVLSPDPPTIATAPENITRAFINMEPVSPYFWSTTTQESYKTSSTSSKVSYDVGNVIIPKKPINLASVPKYRVDFNVRKASVTSSVFSNDVWLSSSSNEIIPRRILPPLKLPVPFLSESSDDFWTAKSFAPKFSLPPIEMPKRVSDDTSENVSEVFVKSEKGNRVIGVQKFKKRVKLSGIRRTLTCLMQRTIKGRKDLSSSPALQEVLQTIREAWTEPRSLLERCRALKRKTTRISAEGDINSSTMLRRPQISELPPRPGASPGLLRRRYSMPETIMRKYCLAQQRSDSDDSGANTAPSRAASPASPSPPRGSCASLCEPQHRFMRRDRELMRKSALLRRLWARPNCNPCSSCCYCNGDIYGGCGRETRSLDGSRSELRHLSSSFTSSRSRESHMLTGWSTPKRQRLESPNNFLGSDEMLRTAMRNSYDRAEESRLEREARDEMSDSTFQSHDREILSKITTSSDTQFTDSTKSNNSGNTEESSDGLCSVTAQIHSERPTSNSSSVTNIHSDEPTYINLSLPPSDVNTTNGLTISNSDSSNNGHIDLEINEEDGMENNDTNIQEEKLSKIDASPYEILEIVVSETLNSSAFDESVSTVKTTGKNEGYLAQKSPIPVGNRKDMHTIDLDEYVSNILVESLNSLTDQLESMNASIGSERKINIVEKEIKIKLQNTGVNTIVHLSPTSNNQIIFGNEELYNKDDKDCCNNIQEHVTIREEVNSVESNNNYLTKDKSEFEETTCQVEPEPIIPHDNVNKAVLQQIQKLFQDEMQNNTDYPPNMMPEISHIEISNVDVFINENADPQYLQSDVITLETDSNSNHDYNYNEHSQDILGGVGSGNYCNIDDPIVVPRFSALPHSESMEVNTSSSEDQDNLGSECTSLVDSLDDPNSPRSMLLRRSFRRSELVRSAIDVLDLLPESASVEESHTKEKCEAFFIRIKDNDCDCEKENIIVADHMPEKIKERLYRRHRKRELRMETAKRKKVKQYKRELEKQRSTETVKSKKDIEKDCVAIMNALVNEVIAKIAQEEYKYMRIKQKSNSNLNNQIQRKTWKKDVDFLNNMESFKISKNGTVHFRAERTEKEDRTRRSRDHKIHGKLSLQAHPPLTPDESEPKRIYQKSEFHDGNKCIEILEILEYVDTSQSSPETTNSDENLHTHSKNRKSKIPIPVYERFSKLNKKTQRPYKSSPILNLVDTNSSATSESNGVGTKTKDVSDELATQCPTRRASVPHETRSRSNSLRFKQVFDIIPEEKSSLSIESPEDIIYNRRVSAPNLTNFNENNNDIKAKKSPKFESKSPTKCRNDETKSIGTSPLSENDKTPPQRKNKNVMTSPIKKSAATSPMLIKVEKDNKSCGTNSAKKSLSSHGTRAGWLGFYKPNKQVLEDEGLKYSKSNPSQDKNDISTVRTIEGNKTDTIIIGKDKRKKTDKISEVKDGKKVFRESSLVRSLSDPQNAGIVLRNDNKRAQVLSVEKNEEITQKRVNKNLSSSDSDSDSGKSLLCSLAPKWLSVGNKKRQVRKKSQDQQQNSAGGWSVTVAGNCYTALPADVEMRLSFPKNSAPHASQSDSGFGDECKSRRPIAAAPKSCQAKHCDNCTCKGEGDIYPPILPPAGRKMTVTLKKESSGSSILASKSMKKSTDSLPDVETYKASKNKSKSSVKMRKGYSLHCWLPGDEVPPITANNGLSVLGCAIIPELKPRVPTMSERDLTRVYTPRHYLRS